MRLSGGKLQVQNPATSNWAAARPPNFWCDGENCYVNGAAVTDLQEYTLANLEFIYEYLSAQGNWRLVFKSNGYALDCPNNSAGSAVQQNSGLSAATEVMILDYGYGLIQNSYGGGLALGDDGSGNLVLTFDVGDAQLWSRIPVDDTYYKIVNQSTGNVITSPSDTSGDSVTVTSWTGSDAQKVSFSFVIN